MPIKTRIARTLLSEAAVLDLLPVTTAGPYLAAAGRLFLVGSGRLTLAVAGNVRGVIENPSNSGRLVKLLAMATFGTGNSFASLYVNPTTGVPVTAARPVNSAYLGDPTDARSIVRVDTSSTTALGGGTDTGIVLGSGGGERTLIELDRADVTLRPGRTLGINLPFSGSADATFTLYIGETDL